MEGYFAQRAQTGAWVNTLLVVVYLFFVVVSHRLKTNFRPDAGLLADLIIGNENCRGGTCSVDGCSSLPYCEVASCDVAWYAALPWKTIVQIWLQAKGELLCFLIAGEMRRPTRPALHVGRVSLAVAPARPTASATQLAMQRLSVHGASGILSARRGSATPPLRHAQRLVEAAKVTWAVPMADANVAIDSGA